VLAADDEAHLGDEVPALVGDPTSSLLGTPALLIV